MKKTAVLLIAFGGPAHPHEIKPFIESVIGGAAVPESRIREVIRHYEVIGGRSPFNEITERQKKALETALKRRGFPGMPVSVGYRHTLPTFKDAFEAYKRFGVERVVGLILTSFRSSVSRERYMEKVLEGRALALAESIEVSFTGPFGSDEKFLEAQASRVREIWDTWSAKEKEESAVFFTAHSIPVPLCEQSCEQNGNRCYGFQFYEASKAIAEKIGCARWRYCYQSRSGHPRDPWLEPDVKDAMRTLDGKRVRRVLLVPVGLLCDNMEVIYDLDHEAKDTARELGMDYYRAGTVSDHPVFVEMMADRVLDLSSVGVIK